MRKRNIRLWTRLSEEEFAVITRRIQKTGLSREAYIRSILLGSVPKEKPDERLYAIMRLLPVIANSVSQLARKAAVFGFSDVLMIQQEAEKWSRFQTDVRRALLLPEKIVARKPDHE